MNYSNTSSAMDTDGECKHNNIAVFECNICFDLAQDPVVTLCGHLFCWPCLYKWLQFHSHSHECPVCKARVDDDNLVPIYGRGASGSDLMAHPASKDDIPSRPASHRPQTAPAPELTHFRQDRTATLFGAISSVLNFRVVDFYDMSDYGATIGGYYMVSSYAHGGYAHGHGFHQYASHVQGTKLVLLMICFLFLGLVVVLMTISTWLFWS